MSWSSFSHLWCLSCGRHCPPSRYTLQRYPSTVTPSCCLVFHPARLSFSKCYKTGPPWNSPYQVRLMSGFSPLRWTHPAHQWASGIIQVLSLGVFVGRVCLTRLLKGPTELAGFREHGGHAWERVGLNPVIISYLRCFILSSFEACLYLVWNVFNSKAIKIRDWISTSILTSLC